MCSRNECSQLYSKLTRHVERDGQELFSLIQSGDSLIKGAGVCEKAKENTYLGR